MKKRFTKDQFPTWTCSSCNRGLLVPLKDTFNFRDTGSSELGRMHEAWEPEWIEYRFCVLLKCNNNQCREVATLTGNGKVAEVLIYHQGIPDQDHIDIFFPEYCCPPPAVFSIPEDTPDQVRNEILDSFSVFFSLPDVAGNRIRASIEALLTSQKVNKTRLKSVAGGKKKRKRLSLHERILKFGEKNQDLSNKLLAIKWLGNEASHTGGLSIDDIFDAYEILNYVLNEIYADNRKRIDELASKINKLRGRRSKKR